MQNRFRALKFVDHLSKVMAYMQCIIYNRKENIVMIHLSVTLYMCALISPIIASTYIMKQMAAKIVQMY